MSAGLPAAGRSEALVSAAALEALIPAPTGWTKVSGRASEVTIAPSVAYVSADASFTKDAMRVRVTISDTDGSADVLLVLATMVTTLPDGHTQTMKPATTITRATYKNWPSAERWDAVKMAGELTVVVNGRFVVALDGSGFESPATLFEVLEAIDFEAVAKLK
jgi:hypothetical protein